MDEAYRRNPERFVVGRPVAARPAQRVMLNPLDAAPPSVATILETPDDQLTALWPGCELSDLTIINLPGAHARSDQGANAT